MNPTAMDYGVVPRIVKDKEAWLEEQDGSWRFYIHVLERIDSGIFVCLEDQAANGGTYHTQDVLYLVRSDNKSPLKSAETTTVFKSCPHLGEPASASTH